MIRVKKIGKKSLHGEVLFEVRLSGEDLEIFKRQDERSQKLSRKKGQAADWMQVIVHNGMITMDHIMDQMEEDLEKAEAEGDKDGE